MDWKEELVTKIYVSVIGIALLLVAVMIFNHANLLIQIEKELQLSDFNRITTCNKWVTSTGEEVEILYITYDNNLLLDNAIVCRKTQSYFIEGNQYHATAPLKECHNIPSQLLADENKQKAIEYANKFWGNITQTNCAQMIEILIPKSGDKD